MPLEYEVAEVAEGLKESKDLGIPVEKSDSYEPLGSP